MKLSKAFQVEVNSDENMHVLCTCKLVKLQNFYWELFSGDLMLAGFVDACNVGLKSLMNAVGPLATMAIGGGAGKALVAADTLTGDDKDKENVDDEASNGQGSQEQGNPSSENNTQGNLDLIRIVSEFGVELIKFRQFFNTDQTLNVKAIQGKNVQILACYDFVNFER